MEQTQIISPWVFYWIDVLSKINAFSIIAVIIAIGLISFLLIVKFMDSYLDEDKLVTINKAIKRLIAISIVCILTTMIIPSQSTMYKMLIANEVTYERAETVIQVIDEKVEAIMDRIEGK